VTAPVPATAPQGGGTAPQPARSPARRPGPARPGWVASAAASSAGGAVDEGAGVLLGLVVWLVTLAYIRDSWGGVRDLARAKFLNKGADGEELP